MYSHTVFQWWPEAQMIQNPENIRPFISGYFSFSFCDFFVVVALCSKHPSSAQMLRDVGAVDFLSQLSPTIEPRLRAVIDGTLDQLFQLPELLPSHSAVYSHGTCSTTTTGVTSWIKYFFYLRVSFISLCCIAAVQVVFLTLLF